MIRANLPHTSSALFACSLCLAQLTSGSGLEVAPQLSDDEFLRSFKTAQAAPSNVDPSTSRPSLVQLRAAALEALSKQDLDASRQSIARLLDALESGASLKPAPNERIDAQFEVSLRLLSRLSKAIESSPERKALQTLPKPAALIARLDALRPELFLASKDD